MDTRTTRITSCVTDCQQTTVKCLTTRDAPRARTHSCVVFIARDYPSASVRGSACMRAACASRTRSSFRTRCATQFSTSSPRKAPRRARCSLEAALSAIATSAAYDLSLEEDGTFKAPMLWHYQAVDAHVDGTISRSHWPDHSLGREYLLVRVLVGEERPGRPYADEAEFNRLPPSRAKHALGELPLLVRIQYMNQCHVLNLSLIHI